jgi:hypothetical protein
MLSRPHNFVRLLLALLLSVQAFVPLSASVEGQMRCAGMAASSRPCARISLPASGLTPQKAYTALMACCRMAKSGCAMRQGCPAMHAPQAHSRQSSQAALSAPRCLVTVRLTSLRQTVLEPQRVTWLAAAALAPPADSPLTDYFAYSTPSHFHPLVSPLPPLLLPCLNGLRAPPAS